MNFFKRKKTILIVEDETDIAAAIEARLSLEGYKILLAPDGQKGVEVARDKKPDMIILDVMMPLVDGYEACKILKREDKTKSIPILMLTALPHVKDADKAFEVGANDFLNKPFNNDRLIEKVQKILPK